MKKTSSAITDTTPFPESPTVLQVIPELGPGGAEQGCIDVAAELVRSGSRSIVVSHGGSRIHELTRYKAIHLELPVHSKNPFIMIKNIKRLRKIIRDYNVDIVHARSRAPAWSAYYACKKTSARFMTTCHASYKFNGKVKRFYNSVMAKGERVIAISHYIGQYLVKNYSIDPKRIRLVHRGISLDKFHPANVAPAQLIKITNQWRLPDGANIIMLPGRLSRIKGHAFLLDALEKLGRKDVYCIFIGADQGRTQYRQELEDLINEKQLGGQVRMIDHCNDMPAAYMCATVVVCASIEPEGFGRIPVEAQAMGRPVIATDHGGAQETIIRGETGWLVPTNDVDAMANALDQALSLTPAQRSILANKSMANVAHNFTIEKMLDDTMDVYAELLQEKYGYYTPAQAAAE